MIAPFPDHCGVAYFYFFKDSNASLQVSMFSGSEGHFKCGGHLCHGPGLLLQVFISPCQGSFCLVYQDMLHGYGGLWFSSFLWFPLPHIATNQPSQMHKYLQ